MSEEIKVGQLWQVVSEKVFCLRTNYTGSYLFFELYFNDIALIKSLHENKDQIFLVFDGKEISLERKNLADNFKRIV